MYQKIISLEKNTIQGVTVILVDSTKKIERVTQEINPLDRNEEKYKMIMVFIA